MSKSPDWYKITPERAFQLVDNRVNTAVLNSRGLAEALSDEADKIDWLIDGDPDRSELELAELRERAAGKRREAEEHREYARRIEAAIRKHWNPEAS